MIKRQRAKGTQKSLDDRDWREKGWEDWKGDLLTALKRYYEKAAQTFDLNKQMFANEACKGVQLLDLLEKRYNVVATNPPYMTREKMSLLLGEYLKINFENTKKDIYSAFIERNLNLIESNGKVAMITLSGFLFQSSFNIFRQIILNNYFTEKFAHLGFHAFEGQIGHDVNSTMFILGNVINNESKSIFFRNTLTDFENKSVEQLMLIKGYNEKKEVKNVFLTSQQFFKDIDNSPFVYWIPPIILQIFKQFSGLGNHLKSISKGITVTPMDKTIRCWWEINNNSNFIPATLAKEQCRYYGHLEYSILLTDQIAKSINSRKIDKIPCLVYNETSRLGFGSRLKPEHYANEFHSISIVPKNIELNYLLGFLNCYLIRFILALLNDTNRFCTDDIKRIPFKIVNLKIEKIVSKLAKSCVNIKRHLIQFSLNDRGFKQTAIQWGYNKLKEQEGGK